MTSGCASSKRPADQTGAGPTWRWLCPAKVNLHLQVLQRRPDGYHEIITVMQPLSLADELKLTVAGSGGLSLACLPEDLPQGRDNLVWRAAESFLTASGLRIGVRLALTKRIPVAAGLGGGSSDAAGTLLALNAATGCPLDDAALHRLGSQLGADVPFFFVSGAESRTGHRH